jgi:predicted CoA-binding protein
MDDIDAILRARTVAIVGWSSDPSYPSESVGRYLQQQGYRVIPVNPTETEVHGERAWPDLASVPEPIDAVVVFRRPEFVPDVVRQAIAVGAKGVWLQEGIVSAEGERLAQEAGLSFVQDACVRTQHRRRPPPA